MREKIFAVLVLFAVAFGGSLTTLATPKTKKRTPPAPRLVTLLPDSDGAMTLDMARTLNQAMPQILSANQPMLKDIMSKIDEMKRVTGIDARQFTEIAAGLSGLKVVQSGFDYDAVVLARGTFDSAAMIEKARAFGGFREEKVGGRTILIFAAEKTVKTAAGSVSADGEVGYIDKLAVGLSKEMALTAYDSNTLVLGSVERVKATIGGGPRLGADVLAMISRKPTALMTFGSRMPTGLNDFLPLDTDELGDSLKGIREMSGWLDVTKGFASVSIAAATADSAQAKSLFATLTTLKAFSGILKASERADQKVYGKMVENLNLTHSENSVIIDLTVPQTDLNVILAPKK